MYLHETSNPLWGQTNHPFDSRRSPGGSSGGDAALVAAGVVMLGIGNDLLGSIRQPAHACGIAGFVPSDTILGSGDAFNTMPSQMVVRARAGFLARRVDDLAMAMESLAVCRSEPSAAEKMRVGWWLDSGPIQASPAVSRAVEEASMRISMSGVDIKRISGHLSIDAAWLHLAIVAADGGREVRQWLQNSRPMRDVERLLRLAALPRSVRHTVAQLAQWTGRSIEAEALRATGIRTDDEFMELVKRRELIRAQWQSMLSEQRCDVILCPVSRLACDATWSCFQTVIGSDALFRCQFARIALRHSAGVNRGSRRTVFAWSLVGSGAASCEKNRFRQQWSSCWRSSHWSSRWRHRSSRRHATH